MAINSFNENASASILGLNAAHISANPELYESARSSFFTFTIDESIVENIKRVAYGGKDEKIEIQGVTVCEAINLSVVNTSVPHFDINVLEYTRGNEKIKFAGTPSWEAGSLKVDDIIGLETKNILMAWQGLAYNIKTRKGGRMKDYKYTCTLSEYTQDYEKIREWTLYGCWISKVDEEAFDRESDSKRQITATLQYDRAELVDA